MLGGAAFPPHRRGWTWGSRFIWPEKPVSPAQAGMPLTGNALDKLGKFPPHRRGWTVSCCKLKGPKGFPPHRRGWTVFSEGSVCFPPHRRGWTAVLGRDPGHDRVSPAQAGMDPLAALIWSVSPDGNSMSVN